MHWGGRALGTDASNSPPQRAANVSVLVPEFAEYTGCTYGSCGRDFSANDQQGITRCIASADTRLEPAAADCRRFCAGAARTYPRDRNSR